MPELLSHYDEVCALVGDDEFAHRILSHYRPPPLPSGCTQAVWLGKDGPALIRNYDFPLEIVSDRFEATRWSGREVIAKAQRPWGGCLDGMNQDGLVASLTAGGSSVQGPGFSVILMLRYILETCRTVAEAIAMLSRIPIALAQNVTVLDRSGDYGTLFLRPDREPAFSKELACTNHQDRTSGPADASRCSRERQRAALDALDAPAMTLEELTSRFLTPPIYSRRAKSPTVYSALYRPEELRADYFWPGHARVQRIGTFGNGEYTHDFGVLG